MVYRNDLEKLCIYNCRLQYAFLEILRFVTSRHPAAYQGFAPPNSRGLRLPALLLFRKRLFPHPTRRAIIVNLPEELLQVICAAEEVPLVASHW